MSSIKIEYTNAEGDFFEVNMESGDRSYQTVSKDPHEEANSREV